MSQVVTELIEKVKEVNVNHIVEESLPKFFRQGPTKARIYSLRFFSAWALTLSFFFVPIFGQIPLLTAFVNYLYVLSTVFLSVDALFNFSSLYYLVRVCLEKYDELTDAVYSFRKHLLFSSFFLVGFVTSCFSLMFSMPFLGVMSVIFLSTFEDLHSNSFFKKISKVLDPKKPVIEKAFAYTDHSLYIFILVLLYAIFIATLWEVLNVLFTGKSLYKEARREDSKLGKLVAILLSVTMCLKAFDYLSKLEYGAFVAAYKQRKPSLLLKFFSQKKVSYDDVAGVSSECVGDSFDNLFQSVVGKPATVVEISKEPEFQNNGFKLNEPYNPKVSDVYRKVLSKDKPFKLFDIDPEDDKHIISFKTKSKVNTISCSFIDGKATYKVLPYGKDDADFYLFSTLSTPDWLLKETTVTCFKFCSSSRWYVKIGSDAGLTISMTPFEEKDDDWVVQSYSGGKGPKGEDKWSLVIDEKFDSEEINSPRGVLNKQFVVLFFNEVNVLGIKKFTEVPEEWKEIKVVSVQHNYIFEYDGDIKISEDGAIIRESAKEDFFQFFDNIYRSDNWFCFFLIVITGTYLAFVSGVIKKNLLWSCYSLLLLLMNSLYYPKKSIWWVTTMVYLGGLLSLVSLFILIVWIFSRFRNRGKDCLNEAWSLDQYDHKDKKKPEELMQYLTVRGDDGCVYVIDATNYYSSNWSYDDLGHIIDYTKSGRWTYDDVGHNPFREKFKKNVYRVFDTFNDSGDLTGSYMDTVDDSGNYYPLQTDDGYINTNLDIDYSRKRLDRGKSKKTKFHDVDWSSYAESSTDAFQHSGGKKDFVLRVDKAKKMKFQRMNDIKQESTTNDMWEDSLKDKNDALFEQFFIEPKKFDHGKIEKTFSEKFTEGLFGSGVVKHVKSEQLVKGFVKVGDESALQAWNNSCLIPRMESSFALAPEPIRTQIKSEDLVVSLSESSAQAVSNDLIFSSYELGSEPKVEKKKRASFSKKIEVNGADSGNESDFSTTSKRSDSSLSKKVFSPYRIATGELLDQSVVEAILLSEESVSEKRKKLKMLGFGNNHISQVLLPMCKEVSILQNTGLNTKQISAVQQYCKANKIVNHSQLLACYGKLKMSKDANVVEITDLIGKYLDLNLSISESCVVPSVDPIKNSVVRIEVKIGESTQHLNGTIIKVGDYGNNGKTRSSKWSYAILTNHLGYHCTKESKHLKSVRVTLTHNLISENGSLVPLSYEAVVLAQPDTPSDIKDYMFLSCPPDIVEGRGKGFSQLKQYALVLGVLGSKINDSVNLESDSCYLFNGNDYTLMSVRPTKVEGNFFKYNSLTSPGSSGSPIICFLNNKTIVLIGLHCAANKHANVEKIGYGYLFGARPSF